MNRTDEIRNDWSDYSNEEMMCVGLGETIDEETAMASEKDILAIMEFLKDRYG